MKTLSTEYRRQLERSVVEARDVAEAGARGALEALAVHHHEPYGHMSGEQRRLRNRLRAHAQHLGDRVDARTGSHTIDHLVHEGAYEHWHGMLFARFLAENYLLIELEMEVAITLDECEELAKEEGVDKWTLAARFAHRTLPQVFRPDHPVFDVQFAREYRLKLEGLVEGLPAEVFTTTDALGWVYQFWQAKKKEEVNRSEVKIGSDELPAVTQLFTEPYMVQFLLHNSLGAWWVNRHPDKACPVDLTYLRRTEDGAPAAGAFDGWPDNLSQFRLLDPCCGSGHFLAAAFLMLVPMRMALEDLDPAEAVDAVLRQNIHGLELDQRCVAIAAFALALEAWRYPDAAGFRTLPKLNLAWCGQPIAGKKEQWLALAEGDSRLEAGMAALYDTFRDAPTLGSLIDPPRSVSEDMLTAGFEELKPLLDTALRKHAGEEDWEETAIAALGLAEATRLLSGHYHLVATNVPYLARGKQSEPLRKFTETHYPKAKNDLANVFLERCLEFSKNEGVGVTQIVMPQNWLFLTTYKSQREHLLKDVRWDLWARLGPGAFETISGEVVNAILLTLNRTRPHTDHQLQAIDVSGPRTVGDKAELLRDGEIISVSQQGQLKNPDYTIAFDDLSARAYLADYAIGLAGVLNGDTARFEARFWEVSRLGDVWDFELSTVNEPVMFGGRHKVILWEGGDGQLRAFAKEVKERLHDADRRGNAAWGRWAIGVSQMRALPSTLSTGEKFDTNLAVILPMKHEHLLPIWTYCSSAEYVKDVRKLTQKLNVTNAALVKVPFDLDHWTKVAAEHYPNGFPKPYSNDPTQWIFHGHPSGAVVWDESAKWTASGPHRGDAVVLHVAVARLLGYRWPAEITPEMELADEQRAWVVKDESIAPIRGQRRHRLHSLSARRASGSRAAAATAPCDLWR